MWRWVLTLVLVLVAAAGVLAYSTQSLPDWFDASSTQTNATPELSFLAEKAEQLDDGRLNLNETEFNALLLSSLEMHPDGERLLSVSDGIRAFLKPDEIEFSVIINLDKLEALDPKARQSVERFDQLFPFLENGRVALTVFGKPFVSQGQVGIQDDFHLKVGAIPISNSSLRQLKVDVERANTTLLPLRALTVSNLELSDGEISLIATPRT